MNIEGVGASAALSRSSELSLAPASRLEVQFRPCLEDQTPHLCPYSEGRLSL